MGNSILDMTVIVIQVTELTNAVVNMQMMNYSLSYIPL